MHRDLEAYLQARLRRRSPDTVGKERFTLLKLFEWAVANDHLACSPASALSAIKGKADKKPFRTSSEIEAIVGRGGLDDEKAAALWDSLYLTPSEIGVLLDLVRERAECDYAHLLHAIPAYTGMRRGEILRLCWSDIEFEQDSLVARSKKQSRQNAEAVRRIDLHPQLKALLLAWRERRPTGQFIVNESGSDVPLEVQVASRQFCRPLRGTDWCLNAHRRWFKVGFHTYRHSFASNLAALGVDQRIINEWMGHQTEAMRKRYRHLYPKDRRSAIEGLNFA